MNATRPYAEASEQNKEPILAVLREVFAEAARVLEIGSGTGQHAVHFARHLPHLVWQTSDLPEHHAGIRAWLDHAALPNARAPLALDVNDPAWPGGGFDGVFSANTAHIMDMASVGALFAGVGRVLVPGGAFALYGPFRYAGRHTSESNARFDAWLRARDPASGIRDLDELGPLAERAELVLVADHPMPVNNRTLVWRRA